MGRKFEQKSKARWVKANLVNSYEHRRTFYPPEAYDSPSSCFIPGKFSDDALIKISHHTKITLYTMALCGLTCKLAHAHNTEGYKLQPRISLGQVVAAWFPVNSNIIDSLKSSSS